MTLPTVVNVSFPRRSLLKTSSGSLHSGQTTAASAGSPARRKGLCSSSSASTEGTVGSPCSRRARARSRRSWTTALPGSREAAYSRLATVYSWPQKTRVVGGSRASVDRDRCMCAAVPSMKRPQPATKSVSPQKSAGAWPSSASRKKDMWPRVWQGVARHRNDSPAKLHVSPAPSCLVTAGVRLASCSPASTARPGCASASRALPPEWSAW
mmetsp:Transcript_28761/g.82323  ORF Transcript_28761/g.82323 Transcript_28761/m.82323 type:complete len:211 (-) Transcript_28761:302-934(-)